MLRYLKPLTAFLQESSIFIWKRFLIFSSQLHWGFAGWLARLRSAKAPVMGIRKCRWTTTKDGWTNQSGFYAQLVKFRPAWSNVCSWHPSSQDLLVLQLQTCSKLSGVHRARAKSAQIGKKGNLFSLAQMSKDVEGNGEKYGDRGFTKSDVILSHC